MSIELGYTNQLTLLAFDHRGSYGEKLFNIKGREPTEEEFQRMSDCKRVIYEGFVKAVGGGVDKEAAAILVDEEYGASILDDAAAAGYVHACPCEKSGQKEFLFEFGSEFGARIAARKPTFTKILVRFNVGSAEDEEMNKRQLMLMKELSDFLKPRKEKFMLELLVPATEEQLAAVGGDTKRYDEETRPGLMVGAIRAMQAAGIEADVWKLEGLDSPDSARMVAEACRDGPGREKVGVVILGRGADLNAVKVWLRNAAELPAFLGFAVGRTIWWDALKGYLAGSMTREEAAALVAKNYTELVDLWNDARAAAKASQ